MKAKTIRKELNALVDRWLDSIPDRTTENLAVKSVARENIIITGGCIVSMLEGKEVNDYDIYFKTRHAAELVAKYYLEIFNVNRAIGTKKVTINGSEEYRDRVKIHVESDGVAKICNPDTKLKFHPIAVTSNAITLSDKVQLIMRFIGDPRTIHLNFDFIHCRCYWQSWNDRLELDRDALESILTKELIYFGSLYPIASLIRMRKFIKRGWTINAGQIIKIAWQISELDLGDLDVLEDQLTGVDLAYFMELITKLREGDQHSGRVIDSEYLMRMIDDIFQ